MRKTRLTRGRTRTIRALLILVLLSTLACDFVGSLASNRQTPVPIGASEEPAASAYPPLPAPKLLFRAPQPHEAQALNAPVELVFDQPMDQRSVTGAFKIRPSVNGDLSWVDTRTLRFTPTRTFDRGTAYQITISDRARNAEGTRIQEPVTLDFTTVGFVEVAEMQPPPQSTEVDPDTTVTVVFNRPIVPLTAVGAQGDLPVPLTFDPPVTGTGSWLNTAVYRFRPEAGFVPATTYTARVAAGLEDTQGSVLDEDVTWTFTTIAPAPLAWSPATGAEFVGPTDVISVTFNQPMDHASTEAAFDLRAMAQTIQGTFRWQGGDSPIAPETLIFTPGAPLPRSAAYTVRIGASAQARNSRVTLAEPLEWTFWTVNEPGVVSVYPEDGMWGIDPFEDVEIFFAGPMDDEGFLDHLTIIPHPTEVYTYWQESNVSVRLAFSKEPATEYHLRLSADTPDRYGVPLGSPLDVRFTTGDLTPYASISALGTIGSFDATTDTLLYARHRNVSRLDLTLYELPLETFMQLHGYGGYRFREAFRPSRSDMIHAWTVPLDAPRNVSHLESLAMTDAQGAQLPPGIYYLEMTTPETLARDPEARPVSYTFVRSRTNLVLKQSPSESLVWALDLATGAPLQGGHVRFYREGQTEEGDGVTDAEGLWMATGLENVDLWDDYFAVLEQPGDATFAIAYNDWDDGIRPWNFDHYGEFGETRHLGYLYTDRPIYRPGQSVYFKGIVRQNDDADYTVPEAIKLLDVRIDDPQGKELYHEVLPVNDMGTFHDALSLDEEAALGTYYLQIQGEAWDFYASTSFRVAEYRAPEFQISVETDQEAYLNGDTIRVTVDAAYYFGGPVANAGLQWNLLSSPYTFAYTCPTGETCPHYSWTDYEYAQDYGETYGSYGELIAQGETLTDDQGRATFEVAADIAEAIQSRQFTIEANITDINDQVVSQRTTTVVHKGAFYVGLTPQSRVAEAGNPQVVDILTVDRESQPVADVALDVVVMEHRWYSVREVAEDGNAYWTWTTEDTPVYTTTARTNAQGRGDVTFVPEKSGSYRVRATGTDDRGNEIRSSTYLWVWGGGTAVWRRESSNRIDLVTDRDLYHVGDTAEILIPSPYTGTVQALVTIERGHIMETQVRRLASSTEVLRIPILDTYVPNVFVSVVLVQGSAASAEGLASFKMGEVMLPVSTETKQLHITLTPDREMASGDFYHPRDTAIYDVTVTDNEGTPVQAELSLRLADLAVLALADETEPTMLERFWSSRGLSVRTSTPLAVAMEAYNRELAPGVKGGGGAEDTTGLIRTRFADTAYWNPVVRTDAEGHARVEVALPDNLTTWRMQARGLTSTTLVGRSEVDVQSTLDLLVRPVLPRFFVVGDRAEIATTVHNNTREDLETAVVLTVEGLTVEGTQEQHVSIPAGDSVRLNWPVTVLPGNEVIVRMEARAGTLFDGREDRLPVYTYSAPEVVATAGRLSEPELRQEIVQLPHTFDPTQGDLTVQVDGSLTAATQNALDYLEHYPYECVEQTVSRFLPNVLTYQALTEMGMPRPELADKLQEQVSLALQRLYNEQHFDGGWGWWVTEESTPYLTAYVLQGLLEAHRAGFTVDQSVMSRAAGFLRDHLPSLTSDAEHWQANRLAYELYVLGEYLALVDGARPRGELGRAVALFKERHRLDRYGQAILAVALGLLEPEEPSRVETLLSDLGGDAVLTATGTHWEEEQPDYRNMNTDVRTTAMVLWAMARHQPDSEMLPNVVRWLMAVRREGYWESTNTTSWALMGLIAYMRASGELHGDFSYRVTLNGEVLADGDVNAATIDAGQEIRVAITQLLADQANRLMIERQDATEDQTGEGQLYYTAHLRYFLPVDEVEALDRGIIVTRQYSLVDDADTTVNEATVGDVIRVKLTLIAPTDLYYVTVEDPLPAGCEAVDVTLNTTSVVGEAPNVRNLTAEEDLWYRWYGWGWWWFSHSEMRDEKVALFTTYLPRGTYEYTYIMRASVPGVYNVIPTTAYEMYFPEVFGRSDGGQFTIHSED